MRANSPRLITKRSAVSWFGMLKTGGCRGGVAIAMSFAARAASFPLSAYRTDRPADKVVIIRRRHFDGNDVARLQSLALDADQAVDVRRVGVAAGEDVVGHLRIGAIHDDVDGRADLGGAPGEGYFLLHLHEAVAA